MTTHKGTIQIGDTLCEVEIECVDAPVDTTATQVALAALDAYMAMYRRRSRSHVVDSTLAHPETDPSRLLEDTHA